MKKPSLEDVFAVMSAASFGQMTERVPVPQDPKVDDMVTRLGIALNVLLDDLSVRAQIAERMAVRLRILAEAAHDFSAATQEDPERLLATVARRLADVVKDRCVVRLVSEDGLSLVPVAVHDAGDAARRMSEVCSDPLPFDQHPLARRVHESGEPFLAKETDLENIRSSTTAKNSEWGLRMGTHSLLIVPLRHRGLSFGQILLTRYRPQSPSFDEQDLDLASALGGHAAIAIANSRSYAAERAARAAAEKAKNDLQASEARYRLMFDSSPLPKWMYDLDTLRFLAVNDAAVRQYGYSRGEFLAMTVNDLGPHEDAPVLLEWIRGANVTPKGGAWKQRKKSGELILVEITTHALTLGERACRLAVGRDVTERIRLEEQLRQSQKMDAIGRLAGGIAHDFNNVLSVILSYGEMLLVEMKPGDRLRGDVEEIRKAGNRAAHLTRQLLMFSRQQVLEPRVLDLNEVLAGMDNMLQRILGADVDLASLPAKSLGKVRVDPGSIEQVIMNLVVNARDAMPTGGKLTMETGNVVLDEEYARAHLGVTPGPHVMLAVTDTGTGMDKATMARIFEPFFTTKETGKGTGLGLSTVFGVAQQSGGSVWVYSELGEGTTFKVYLPRVDAAVQVVSPSPSPACLRGSETILLAEDDDQVRAVARSILGENGYHVIEARNAGEALLYSEKHVGKIHLLLTDVVMPHMSGPELAKRLASARPHMKVLCMSGYTDDSVVRHGVLREHIAFIQKPITPASLTMKVREVLESGLAGKDHSS